MLMAKCCVCTKRISLLDGDLPLSSELDKYKLCGKCSGLLAGIRDVERNHDVVRYEQSKKELEEYLNKIEIKEVKDEIENLISKHESEYENEKIRNDTDYFRLNLIREKAKTFLCTTGYNFEGYSITKYLNIAHGEAVLGTSVLSEFNIAISDILGSTSNLFEGKLSKAKALAESQLIANCILKGGNAVIGVDFDVSSLNNNVIMVSANGTCVVIEKNT